MTVSPPFRMKLCCPSHQNATRPGSVRVPAISSSSVCPRRAISTMRCLLLVRSTGSAVQLVPRRFLPGEHAKLIHEARKGHEEHEGELPRVAAGVADE